MRLSLRQSLRVRLRVRLRRVHKAAKQLTLCTLSRDRARPDSLLNNSPYVHYQEIEPG